MYGLIRAIIEMQWAQLCAEKVQANLFHQKQSSLCWVDLILSSHIICITGKTLVILGPNYL